MIKNPNDIVDHLVTDFLDVLGERLICVVMHGCAVSHEFIPGKSVITVSIVLSDLSVECIQQCVPVQTYWAKKGVVVSYYFTPELLQKLEYSHPVELLEIKNGYRVLYGDDLFCKMELQEEYLIIQCECEIRSILMKLRSDFVNIYKKEKEIKSVLMNLFPCLLPIFSAILISVDRKTCRSESEIISGIEDLCGLGISVLSDLFCDNQRLKKQNVDLLVRFVKTIEKIENFVNEIRKKYTESK